MNCSSLSLPATFCEYVLSTMRVLVLHLPDRDPLRLLHALQQHQQRVLLSSAPAVKLLHNFTAGMRGRPHVGRFFPIICSSCTVLLRGKT